MKKYRIDVFLFASLVISYVVASCSFMLIAVETDRTVADISLMSFLAGVLFWAFLVISVVLQIVLSVKRRRFYKKYNLKQNGRLKRTGLLSFFRNKAAVFADICLFLSIAGLVAVFFMTGGTGSLCYIMISLVLLFICLHSLFNGKLYFYICALNKTIRTNEKK